LAHRQLCVGGWADAAARLRELSESAAGALRVAARAAPARASHGSLDSGRAAAGSAPGPPGGPGSRLGPGPGAGSGRAGRATGSPGVAPAPCDQRRRRGRHTMIARDAPRAGLPGPVTRARVARAASAPRNPRRASGAVPRRWSGAAAGREDAPPLQRCGGTRVRRAGTARSSRGWQVGLAGSASISGPEVALRLQQRRRGSARSGAGAGAAPSHAHGERALCRYAACGPQSLPQRGQKEGAPPTTGGGPPQPPPHIPWLSRSECELGPVISWDSDGGPRRSCARRRCYGGARWPAAGEGPRRNRRARALAPHSRPPDPGGSAAGAICPCWWAFPSLPLVAVELIHGDPQESSQAHFKVLCNEG
jgi:hypothetical protein